jgi:type IVB pilus formation R64 PilN family outer membrane protein
MKNLAISISLLSALTLSGCSGSSHSDKWEEIKSETTQATSSELAKTKMLMLPKEGNHDHVKDEFFIGYTALDIVKRNRNNLPKEFYQNISVFSKEGIKEDKIPEMIYKDFGIIVDFVKQKDSSSNEEDSLGEETTQLDLEIDSSAPSGLDIFGMDSLVETEEEELIEYDFNGDLKGLLDYITIAIDKKWEYDSESQKVYFYKYRTEIFDLLQAKESITKSTTITTESSSSGAGDGGTSGNSQTIQFSSELNSWDDMQNNIENMLSEDASSSFDPTEGTVIVTDSDYVLSGIRKYVHKINEDASKQVLLDMRIINVKVKDEANFGMNWSAVNQAVSSSLLGGNITSSFSLGSTARASNFLQLDNSSTGMGALFSALNEFSNFKVSNNLNATTMNNKPVPMQVVTEVTYFQSVTSETTEQGTERLVPTIATVKEGITVTVTPKIHDQNVVLDYSMNLSVIDEIKEVGNLGAQTPVISLKNFTQRVIAKNGEPLIVAAFDKVNKNGGSSSPFSGDLWFLGGSEKTSEEKETVLIVITPYIVSNN